MTEFLSLTSRPHQVHSSGSNQSRQRHSDSRPQEPAAGRRRSTRTAPARAAVVPGAIPRLDPACAREGRPGRGRREDALLGRRGRVLQRRRQALAVLDLDLEAHPLLALRAAVGVGEEVVGALLDEKDRDGVVLLEAAAAVDVGGRRQVVGGVAEVVGGGVGSVHHRRVVVRLEYW